MTPTTHEEQRSILRNRRARWPIRRVSCAVIALIATSAGLGAVAQHTFVETNTRPVPVQSVPADPNSGAVNRPGNVEAPAMRCSSIHPAKVMTVQYRSSATQCATLLRRAETEGLPPNATLGSV